MSNIILTGNFRNIEHQYQTNGRKTLRISNSCNNLIFSGVNEDEGIRKQLYSVDNIGNNVKKLDTKCFYKCEQLRSCKLPESVLSVGEKAFADCTNLTSISLLDINSQHKFEELGDYCFSNTGLEHVRISITNPISKQVAAPWSHIFENNKNLKSVYIDDQYIGDFTFKNCTSLSSVTFADKYSWKTESTFEGCTNLEQIEFPPNFCNGLGRNYFKGCVNLSKVDLTHISVEHTGYYFGIDDNAFDGCENLTEISLPPISKTFDTLGLNAFKNSSLQRISCLGIDDSDFDTAKIVNMNGYGLDHDCIFYSKSGTEFRFMYNPGTIIPSTRFPYLYIDEVETNTFRSGVWYQKFTDVLNYCRTNHIPLISYYSGGNRCNPCSMLLVAWFGRDTEGKTLDFLKQIDPTNLILSFTSLDDVPQDQHEAMRKFINDHSDFNDSVYGKPYSIMNPYLFSYYYDSNNVEHYRGVYPTNIDSIEKFKTYVNGLSSWGVDLSPKPKLKYQLNTWLGNGLNSSGDNGNMKKIPDIVGDSEKNGIATIILVGFDKCGFCNTMTACLKDDNSVISKYLKTLNSYLLFVHQVRSYGTPNIDSIIRNSVKNTPSIKTTDSSRWPVCYIIKDGNIYKKYTVLKNNSYNQRDFIDWIDKIL